MYRTGTCTNGSMTQHFPWFHHPWRKTVRKIFFGGLPGAVAQAPETETSCLLGHIDDVACSRT